MGFDFYPITAILIILLGATRMMLPDHRLGHRHRRMIGSRSCTGTFTSPQRGSGLSIVDILKNLLFFMLVLASLARPGRRAGPSRSSFLSSPSPAPHALRCPSPGSHSSTLAGFVDALSGSLSRRALQRRCSSGSASGWSRPSHESQDHLRVRPTAWPGSSWRTGSNFASTTAWTSAGRRTGISSAACRSGCTPAASSGSPADNRGRVKGPGQSEFGGRFPFRFRSERDAATPDISIILYHA